MDYKKDKFEFEDRLIRITQDSSYGYAGQIWDAAKFLCHFMSHKKTKNLFKDKIILEIGSGTGICGIFASTLGAKKVILTDREENLQILKDNIELNKDTISTGCDVVVTCLNWNNIVDFKNVKDKIDIIIASDIVYHGNNFVNIIHTLSYFSQLNKTEVLLSYNIRTGSSGSFFDLLETNWQVKKFDEAVLGDHMKIFEDESVILMFLKKIK